MSENESANLIEWLKGKKTYLLVIAAFIYGGGIQIQLWGHYPLVDALLAGGTAASLRAGIAKAQITKLILVCALCLGLTSCATTNGGVSPTARIAAMTFNALQKLGGSFAAGELDKNDLHAIADGLRTFEGNVQPITAADIQAIVNAWSSNPDPAAKKSLGQKLQDVWTSSAGVRKDVVLEAMATAAQIFATQFGNNHASYQGDVIKNGVPSTQGGTRSPSALIANDQPHQTGWIEARP